MRLAPLLSLGLLLLASPAIAQPALTAEAVNAADIANLLSPPSRAPAWAPASRGEAAPDPAMVRLQILLDRAGTSPGVIDGYDGENVRKAILAFETMRGLPADGQLDDGVLGALETGDQVIGTYEVTAEDIAAIVPAIPSDYAEMAQLEFLGYTSVSEALGERFHMAEKLLVALNPGSGFAPGDTVLVAAYGPDLEGEVVRIEADKALRQIRAYDAEDRLIAAYPATIGSEDNPSPTGTHTVEAVAPMPNYTYNPEVNFQQGDNTSVLTIPPGPNGPVGSMWIDLSEPTYGIHGTPEPAKIDKTGSHGCIRLTNWDANELAAMVTHGVPVVFLD